MAVRRIRGLPARHIAHTDPAPASPRDLDPFVGKAHHPRQRLRTSRRRCQASGAPTITWSEVRAGQMLTSSTESRIRFPCLQWTVRVWIVDTLTRVSYGLVTRANVREHAADRSNYWGTNPESPLRLHFGRSSRRIGSSSGPDGRVK
jgi:hypothetical protein